MQFSQFNVISLDGSVTKPEPGLDFARYQVALAQYRTALGQRSRAQARRVDLKTIEAKRSANA